MEVEVYTEKDMCRGKNRYRGKGRKLDRKIKVDQGGRGRAKSQGKGR